MKRDNIKLTNTEKPKRKCPLFYISANFPQSPKISY